MKTIFSFACFEKPILPLKGIAYQSDGTASRHRETHILQNRPVGAIAERDVAEFDNAFLVNEIRSAWIVFDLLFFSQQIQHVLHINKRLLDHSVRKELMKKPIPTAKTISLQVPVVRAEPVERCIQLHNVSTYGNNLN